MAADPCPSDRIGALFPHCLFFRNPSDLFIYHVGELKNIKAVKVSLKASTLSPGV